MAALMHENHKRFLDLKRFDMYNTSSIIQHGYIFNSDAWEQKQEHHSCHHLM